MHLKSILAACAVAGSVVSASPLVELVDRQTTSKAGYLATVFKGSDEQVYFFLANKNSPQGFTQLNGGGPSLVATKGTKGARDPSALVSNDGKKLYVLATDLQIATTNWGDAQSHGSLSLHVWESTDGVNWSADRLVQVMDSTAGYVWAPSAVWDPKTKSYAVFWSSQVYASSDPDHTGPAQGPFIYYSHTTDFINFDKAQRWDPNNSATVIDQEIQYLGGSSYVRYLSDTQQVRRVVLDRSDNGLFGTWNRIGVPVDQVREGPASFRDINNPNTYYLWEDNYNGAGYECYQTTDFKVPYAACPNTLQPGGMRHGGVIQLDQTRFSALSRNITG